MKQWFQVDERTSMITGQVAYIFLLITQVSLIIAFLYRIYGLGHDPGQYNDLRIILAGSILGYWFSRAYLGGFLAQLTIRRSLLIYAILASIVAFFYVILSGIPVKGEWKTFILVAAVAPALILGGLALFHYWGRRRIEKSLSSDASDRTEQRRTG